MVREPLDSGPDDTGPGEMDLEGTPLVVVPNATVNPAYLRRSVVNGCNSHHRRVRLERTLHPHPAAAVIDLDADEITDALAALPRRQRATLVLRFYLDLPDAEAAEILGCRVGTVGSLVHRGLAQLRKDIEQ